MVKTKLNSDLDFIKEFEELRLKQKLLVETLSKKNSSEMNKYLLDINSKLDFLVKIFKESTSSEDMSITQLDEKLNSYFSKIIDKISFVETNLNEKIDNVKNNIGGFSKLIEKTEGIVEKNLEKQDLSELTNEIPKPNFNVDESKKKAILEEGVKNKKKKWF